MQAAQGACSQNSQTHWTSSQAIIVAQRALLQCEELPYCETLFYYQIVRCLDVSCITDILFAQAWCAFFLLRFHETARALEALLYQRAPSALPLALRCGQACVRRV